MRIEKDGHAINSISDWKLYAPPKAAYHWVAGRSAYELAHAWCGDGQPVMPAAMRALLDSRPETAGMVVECVFPEHRITFDSHGGEPRNADLAFTGSTSAHTVAVTIEAKADEPYGLTIAKTSSAAHVRRITNPLSKGIERITDLIAALLPPGATEQSCVDDLYYQLLTATAGTLAYAVEHSAPVGVLVIHEFITDKTKDALHARNAEAYQDFIQRLRGDPVSQAELHGLIGPFNVPGRPLFPEVPALLIGKITTNLRNTEGGSPAEK